MPIAPNTSRSTQPKQRFGHFEWAVSDQQLKDRGGALLESGNSSEPAEGGQA